MAKINLKIAALCIAVGTIVILAGWFSFFLVSKHRNNSRDASAILTSLSDFTYVGQGAFSNELSVPAHGMERQPLPKKLEAGHSYIFHYGPVDNGQLVHELINRLKTRGVKVFDVVDHGTGTYVGESHFSLSFQDGGYKGFIYNTEDNQIVKDEKIADPLSVADYILVIQEVKP
jgi:hypothetical protein